MLLERVNCFCPVWLCFLIFVHCMRALGQGPRRWVGLKILPIPHAKPHTKAPQRHCGAILNRHRKLLEAQHARNHCQGSRSMVILLMSMDPGTHLVLIRTELYVWETRKMAWITNCWYVFSSKRLSWRSPAGHIRRTLDGGKFEEDEVLWRGKAGKHRAHISLSVF